MENDDSTVILPDHSIAGDNAFVETKTMSTPVPGLNVTQVEDAYNFYLSQLRITIERAFGILVHRWGVLRRPLSESILKVPALVICLMRLHNFCIDTESCRTPAPIRDDLRDDEAHIQRIARRHHAPAVSIDKRGIPTDLMGSGHHFQDEPGGTGRRPVRRRQRLPCAQ